MKVKTIILIFILSLPVIFYFGIRYRSPDPFSIRRGDFLSVYRLNNRQDWTITTMDCGFISIDYEKGESVRPFISYDMSNPYLVQEAGFRVLLNKETDCPEPEFDDLREPLLEKEVAKLDSILRSVDYEILDASGYDILIKNTKTGEVAEGSPLCIGSELEVYFSYPSSEESAKTGAVRKFMNSVGRSEIFDEIFTYLFVNFEK